MNDIVGSGGFTVTMIELYPELYTNLFTTNDGLYCNDKAIEFIKKNNLPKSIKFQDIIEYIVENEDKHDWWML